MIQSEDTDFSLRKKFATYYYHYLQNRPGEVYRLVENFNKNYYLVTSILFQ